jgi:hypothetical protein
MESSAGCALEIDLSTDRTFIVATTKPYVVPIILWYSMYVEIFAGQKFRQAQLPSYCKKCFANMVKVAISSMQSLTEDKKHGVMKFSSMRAHGKIFLLVKISTYYNIMAYYSN